MEGRLEAIFGRVRAIQAKSGRFDVRLVGLLGEGARGAAAAGFPFPSPDGRGRSQPGAGSLCGRCAGGARLGVAVPSPRGSDPPLSARCEKGFAAPQFSLSSTNDWEEPRSLHRRWESSGYPFKPVDVVFKTDKHRNIFSKPNFAEVVQAKPLSMVKWQLLLYPVFLDASMRREFLWLYF